MTTHGFDISYSYHVLITDKNTAYRAGYIEYTKDNVYTVLDKQKKLVDTKTHDIWISHHRVLCKKDNITICGYLYEQNLNNPIFKTGYGIYSNIYADSILLDTIDFPPVHVVSNNHLSNYTVISFTDDNLKTSEDQLSLINKLSRLFSIDESLFLFLLAEITDPSFKKRYTS
jgi:hypothetical protein